MKFILKPQNARNNTKLHYHNRFLTLFNTWNVFSKRFRYFFDRSKTNWTDNRDWVECWSRAVSCTISTVRTLEIERRRPCATMLRNFRFEKCSKSCTWIRELHATTICRLRKFELKKVLSSLLVRENEWMFRCRCIMWIVVKFNLYYCAIFPIEFCGLLFCSRL